MNRLVISLSLCLVLLAPLCAWSEQGYEIMPGVQFIPGANGGTFGVETLPGVRHYRGEFEGSAIDTAPGVRSYNFRESQEPPRESMYDVKPAWERKPLEDYRPQDVYPRGAR